MPDANWTPEYAAIVAARVANRFNDDGTRRIKSGQLGNYGGIIFEVNPRRISGLSERTSKTSGRWTDHEAINEKPIKEFNGPALRGEEFVWILDTAIGCNPDADFDLIDAYSQEGRHFPFIWAGKPYRNCDWVILEAESEHTGFAPGTGITTRMEVTVTLGEYN